MAEDDIYGNKARYAREIKGIEKLVTKPTGKRRYYCKNKVNLQYFYKLLDHFEMRDLSFIRRIRLMHILKICTHVANKDLQECDRPEINSIVAFSHKTHKTLISKKDFIKDIKCIWRVLFPEKDHKGRIDETLVPYPVRHLNRKVDKSKEKLRNDRLTIEEFKKVVQYFAKSPKMQAYIMLAYESLGRPQEILYTRIKDYQFFDNYAKVWISEHGKEGIGFLQCIDSYPYVMRWYEMHLKKDDPEAFMFFVENNRNKFAQLTNHAINIRLRTAMKELKINKRFTCYSIKRNGVTHRRERGQSDVQIQHAARWTSTKQLQIYDMTTQQDALKIELRNRGLANKDAKNISKPTTKDCVFCAHRNGFTSEFCTNCKRPLNREKIQEIAIQAERISNNVVLQRFNKMEQMFEKMLKTS